jgi:hypothetical protein
MPAEPLPSSPKLERQQVKGTGSDRGRAGVRKLAIELNDVTELTLAVLLTPDAEAPAPKLEPLAKW